MMSPPSNRIGFALALSVVAIVLDASFAVGQYASSTPSRRTYGGSGSSCPGMSSGSRSRYRPYTRSGYGRYARGYGSGQSLLTSTLVQGTGGYAYSYPDPAESYLRGGADVILGQASYLVAREQGELAKEHAVGDKIEARRRAFDAYLDGRDTGGSVEDERERQHESQLDRSRDAPLTEIYSATALNTLLVNIQKCGANGCASTDTALEPEVLRQVNVTADKSGAHAGLLKQKHNLVWPLAFQGPGLKAEQAAAEKGLAQAIRDAAKGSVDPTTVKMMKDGIGTLRKRLQRDVAEVTPARYLEAQRFLAGFDALLVVLSRPDAADYFNGKYTAKGKSIGDLVKHMTDQGLRFAPALAGEESAYVALHQALVAYDRALEGNLAASDP